MRKTGIFILGILMLLFIPDCKKEESGPAQATQEDLAGHSDAVALKQGTTDSEDPEAKVPDAGKARIAFGQKDFDFGQVETGEGVEHMFTFRNTGNGILRIHKVRSS